MDGDPLRASDVRKVYTRRGERPVEALKGVSLVVRPAERIALLGRNGAGKTTFLRIASTLLAPSSGVVTVFGHDVASDPGSVRPLIAVVPQEGKPFFHLTPREQVYTYLRTRGFSHVEAKNRTDDALVQMELSEFADRLTITLSGGQRQRTMVATVIATEAPLLFLDEPTIGLDPFARRRVWESLRRLTRGGSTLLLTTHYLDEAEALSDRLYIIERGKVLVDGTAASLKAQVGGSVRISIEGGERCRPVFASFGTGLVDGGVLHVITTPERVPEALALAARERLATTIGPVTLEEAFLRVVGRSIDEE
jgi:ABC-2 type transport system ATP-binding protein